MTPYKRIKEQAYEAAMELVKQKLIIHTFGNVSELDRAKGVFAIKPSGIPYKKLKANDMVVVDLRNNIVEGRLKPSSDTKTHSMLYRNFAEIGGVVHTHSSYATAWAQALRPIPILGTTHADFLPQEVPCTKIMSDEQIKGNYEEAIGRQILEVFKNISYKDVRMVLVACHGPFVWGKDAKEAVYNGAMLEELAKMAFLTLQINPQVSSLKKTLIKKHYERKHGKNSYYGQK
ncbi:MAG: L-ribulose-5-phosphate 4-epimerase AraD [Candidatus Ratteibacteria bacterium]|nr:L-ribulose-5-phosphate 4-epimerase AraD [Candidatus Ratteibacteria bacterium]